MSPYPDDDDGYALEQMRAGGVDMSQPLLIEFFIAVPDESSARSVEAALVQQGYECQIVYDDGEPEDEPDTDEDGVEAARLANAEDEDDGLSGDEDMVDELQDEFGPSWSISVGLTMIPEYSEVVHIQQELEQIASPFGGHADGWGVMVDGTD